MKYFLKRTAAYLIDYTVVFILVMGLVQWLLFSNLRPLLDWTDEWMKDSWNMQLYVLSTISLPVYIYFILFERSTLSATPGKYLMRLKVKPASEHGKLSTIRIAFRTILKFLPWEIAHIGVIFPVPTYYMDQPEIRWPVYVGITLFIIYVASILINSSGRSLYDKCTGIVVSVKGQKKIIPIY